MCMISFGWASGDVSLAAYIQSHLSDTGTADEKTSPLGAVMSLLYVLYLVIFFGLNLLMGHVRDVYTRQGLPPEELFTYIGGVFLTVSAVIVFISTFIPKGSATFCPDPAPEDEAIAELDESELLPLSP